VSAEDRLTCKALVDEANVSGANKAKACEQLGVSVRTVERWAKQPSDQRKGPIAKPGHTLTTVERQRVVDVSNSEEYANLPPGQIVPLLADKGEYVASESSFYRVLKAADLMAHRSKSQPRQHVKPKELVATAPNQLWSWDITYLLRSTIRGMFFYLYLPLDIFSRAIVHWEVHENENAELAALMIETACAKQAIRRDQITLHSDNGGPMKGATMLATLQTLGVATSFSRPRVSDDNPYSESLFKTLKYCPSYPEHGFADIEEARAWVEKFVYWYNNVHLHSGINWVTPACRHSNQDLAVLTKRHAVYEAARKRTPSRWSGDTRNWKRVEVVELNPGRASKKASTGLLGGTNTTSRRKEIVPGANGEVKKNNFGSNFIKRGTQPTKKIMMGSARQAA
jgi:putative transposase